MNITPQKIVAAVLLLYGAGYLFKNQTAKLEFFTASEFGVWYPLMNNEFLFMLDDFRREVGEPVYISPALGSLGRPDSLSSQHFPNPEIRAADLMSKAPLEKLYAAALKVGFTGIGLYPDWQPDHGIHVDNRTDRQPHAPATWSAFKNLAGNQEYTGIQKALA